MRKLVKESLNEKFAKIWRTGDIWPYNGLEIKHVEEIDDGAYMLTFIDGSREIEHENSGMKFSTLHNESVNESLNESEQNQIVYDGVDKVEEIMENLMEDMNFDQQEMFLQTLANSTHDMYMDHVRDRDIDY